MTRIGTYIFACSVAAFSTAAMAQQLLPKGTQLPNGALITGYGVGPAGNAIYTTTKGPALQTSVNKNVAGENAAVGSKSSGTPLGTWSVVKNAPTAPAAPAPAAVKAH